MLRPFAMVVGVLVVGVLITLLSWDTMRGLTRQVDHGKVALPGLAQPALAREFLHVPGALAVRVTPAESQPHIGGHQQRDQDQHPDDYRQSLACLRMCNVPAKRCCVHVPPLANDFSCAQFSREWPQMTRLALGIEVSHCSDYIEIGLAR